MSAVATSSCDSSQGRNAGFSRSPSIRTSESMTQRMLRLAFQLADLLLDGVGSLPVQFPGLVGSEQLRRLASAHEHRVGHQAGNGPAVFTYHYGLAMLDLAQETRERSRH